MERHCSRVESINGACSALGKFCYTFPFTFKVIVLYLTIIDKQLTEQNL